MERSAAALLNGRHNSHSTMSNRLADSSKNAPAGRFSTVPEPCPGVNHVSSRASCAFIEGRVKQTTEEMSAEGVSPSSI